jgi:hypothetical protein
VKKGAYDVRFYDGIQLLKNDLHQISGYTSLDTFLRNCMDSLGFELPIYVMINITPAAFITPNYGPENIRTQFEGLLDRKPEASYYELLFALLKVFKAFIVQEDGAWYIKQHAHRENTQIFRINTNGTVVFSIDNEQLTIGRMLADSSFTNVRGISSLVRTTLNNNTSSALLNADFTDWNADRTELNGWLLEAGTISPPFLFNDFQGFYFTNSNTKLYQKSTRILTGYGEPTFTFSGTIYMDGTAGSHDIAIAELIVYIRDASNREAGFTKYYAHKPSVSTLLSTTRKLVYASVQIPSGHSTNVPIAFEAEINVPLALYKDFYYAIRLVDENEPETTTSNGRRRKINSIQVDIQGSLQETASEDDHNTNSANTNGIQTTESVYFNDDLQYRREVEFQGRDENLDWIDVYLWRNISGTTGHALNEKVVDNFLDVYSSSRLFVKITLPSGTVPKIRTKLTLEHEGQNKTFAVTYVQQESSFKPVKVYAIEL